MWSKRFGGLVLGLGCKMNNSFSKKFITRSIVVVVGLFLTIYFSFNGVAQNFINNITDNYLRVQIHNNNAETVSLFTAGGWQEVPMTEMVVNALDLTVDTVPRDSLALAILTDTFTDNYLILNERGVMISSGNVANMNQEFVVYEGIRMDQRLFFANYYRFYQDRFRLNETTTVRTDDGLIFHVRPIATDYLGDIAFPHPPYPLTILFFTEVTEIVNFRQSVNQILSISLLLAAVMILAVTTHMSNKFRQSTDRLSSYAKELGHGQFDASAPAALRYAEFQTLSNSMTDMANMLAAYEVNQKQFFQNASHELRTPLMAIQCYSEGILADVFTPIDAAHIINAEVDKMTELVSSILYLSRIDHHSFQLEPTNINEFLQNCYEEIEILAKNNNKTIMFDPLVKDLQLNVDAGLLERAVVNILTNALRYTKSEIIIKTETFMQRNIFANVRQQMVRITIFNDGEQIDAKDLPHIFDRFYKGKGGNTGIGLSITKEIITAFNGSVTADNVDNGVEFTIELPVLP